MSNKFQKPVLTELDLLLFKNKEGNFLVVRHIFAKIKREEFILPTTKYASDRVTDLKNKLKSHGLSIQGVNLECDRKMSRNYEAYRDDHNRESFEVCVLSAEGSVDVDGENSMFVSLEQILNGEIKVNGEIIKFSPLTISVAKVLVEEQMSVMTA